MSEFRRAWIAAIIFVFIALASPAYASETGRAECLSIQSKILGK
jgi:hypothetical protein